MRRGRTGATWVMASGVLLVPGLAQARPGTHPVGVATWDARASSVSLAGLGGGHDGGGTTQVSYWANFSSTSGILSAQFGAHYIGLKEGSRYFYGVSASGTAVFDWAVVRRYDNGVPRVGIGWSLGAAPAALIGGDFNYFTLPLVTGLAVPLSPVESVTIAPWGEIAPSLNLDTHFQPFSINPADYADLYNPQTGAIDFDAQTASSLFRDTVSLELGGGFSARGGLNVEVHFGERTSLSLRGGVATLGDWAEREVSLFAGGGLLWRWDRIVPAVLPAWRRLADEDCAAVAERYRTCTTGTPAGTPSSPAAPSAAPPGAAPPAGSATLPPVGAGPSETQPRRPASAAPPAVTPAPPSIGAGPSETRPMRSAPATPPPAAPPRVAPPPAAPPPTAAPPPAAPPPTAAPPPPVPPPAPPPPAQPPPAPPPPVQPPPAPPPSPPTESFPLP